MKPTELGYERVKNPEMAYALVEVLNTEWQTGRGDAGMPMTLSVRSATVGMQNESARYWRSS